MKTAKDKGIAGSEPGGFFSLMRVLRKADFFLFAIFLALGISLIAFSVFGHGAGKTLKITVDGEVYGMYDLAKDRTLTIKEHGHLNKVRIKDGKAVMTEADCRNQICVHEKAIDSEGRSIVCLPNKVVLEVIGGESDYDAVSK